MVCEDFICLIAASRVVNINGQNILMSSKLCGVGFYDISKILRPQMCLGGLYKAGQALFNWKRPNGGGGQPHITANSCFKIGRIHIWPKGHSFGGVRFE